MTTLKARTRALARHGALDVLSARYRLQSLQQDALETPRVSLPYLHAVPHDEEDSFRAFVKELAKTHTFISYSEAVERVKRGPIDKPYVSFSFDDGFKSNVRTARILEEFGARGMFFVPPGFIGTETVGEARDFYGFSEGVDEPAMTWSDLEQLLESGHEIGNHTLGHKVMSWVDDTVMENEIHEGATQLRTRLGPIEHFAWPRGRFFHFTEQAARAVFDSGHTSCASAERGAHTVPHSASDETLCLRRDHIMTHWPLRHSMYFIAKSSRRAGRGRNAWPEEWNVA